MSGKNLCNDLDDFLNMYYCLNDEYRELLFGVMIRFRIQMQNNEERRKNNIVVFK